MNRFHGINGDVFRDKTIISDVDGPVCDLHTPWYAEYNEMYNDTLTRAAVSCWEVHRLVKPECGKNIYRFLDDGHLYDKALPVPEALEAIQQLRAWGARVVFATSTERHVAAAKRGWLERHGFLPDVNGHMGPQRDLVFATDKSLLRCADLIVDDYDVNLLGWGRKKAVLWDAPWNKDTIGEHTRAMSWGAVLRIAEDNFTVKPETTLEEAQRLVYGSRGKDYGHPLDDYERTSAAFTALIQHKLRDGQRLTAEDMVRGMIVVKLSRDVHAAKRDNRVDMAGYAECLQRITEERARRAGE